MKRRAYLVSIYCERKPDAHWLAGVYRGGDGALRIQFDPRRLLDPEIFQPLLNPAQFPDGIADMPLWEGQSGDPLWFRCRCTAGWPLSVDRPELLEAAAHPTARGITAVPTARLRGSEASEPLG